MATTQDLESIEERMLQVHGRYMLHFAEQSRLTRHVEILTELVPELEQILTDLEAFDLADEKISALKAQAQERRDLYTNERKLIEEAQGAGPRAVEVAVLLERAEILRAAYGRHYAGASRLTRDWLKLDGMVDDMVEIQQALSTLSSGYGSSADVRAAVKSVASELDLYRREVREIKAAQRSATGEKRFGMLATLANEQFANYRGHFAGQGRGSRRIERLELLVSNLSLVYGNMKRLALSELSLEAQTQHRENMEMVSERGDAYRAELEAVRTAQNELETPERAASLENEARRILSSYQEGFAGQDRSSRDLDALSVLCDRITDVEAQLRSMVGAFATLELLTQAHTLAADALSLLTREHRRVREAQAGDATTE